MFHRVLLKPKQKTVEEHDQRKKAFKTKCKVQGKCYNPIVYCRSTKNLVSKWLWRNSS